VDYRGHVIEEFDLDAALARRPKVILVDELAHTNAAGSRHPKRWQDVEELLAAGIDVFTTMNVQHIESLNDIVAQITRIQVRETVPDSVIDEADVVELVDIAPEELLQRLQEGKVYLAEQAKLAADHFFQRGNLLALRELALRRTAQHVDEDVLEYREALGLSSNVPAGERLLVCVGPAPSSGHLIRATARLAAGLRCPWVAAYVEGTTLAGLTEGDRERLETHLRLAESLGATITRLTGNRVSEALLGYARRQNVSRILIGKPTHSRLRDRLRGSLLDEVVRGSGDIDVHVISGNDTGRAETTHKQGIHRGFQLAPYLVATLLVGLTLALAAFLCGTLKLPDPEMLFLITVMITAIWFGRGPSLYAAALGVAAYDFFFVPPYLTFSVTDRRYFLTFAVMFGIEFVLSELTGRIKRQEHDALAREQRTSVLYSLTKELSSAVSAENIAAIAARHAADVFAAKALVLEVNADHGLTKLGSWPAELELDTKELGVAKWALDRVELAGLGTDTLPGSASICAPLRVGGSALGVLQLQPSKPRMLGSEQRSFLDVFCRQLGVALERVRLAEEARAAVVRAKTEEMRSSLLSTVSHDLRTPLASITGAATALRDDSNLSLATRVDLVGSICDEAERLERLVTNLLDMTRLESGSLSLRKDWIPLEELVGSALTRLESKLAKHSVRVDIPPNLTLVYVDPVLFEQVFVNIFENAAKYTPLGSRIEIGAVRSGEHVCISVRDDGPGVPEEFEKRLFEKFSRGPNAGTSGAGLGLAICRGIIEAHGGSIHAKQVNGGGLLLGIGVPIGGTPPQVVGRADHE
jgi:two-component system sensor histidine kinase KdpD